MATALRSGGMFDEPQHIASDPTGAHGLRIAASGNGAYVAYTRGHDGGVYFRGWAIGPAPAYTLTTRPVRVVDPGTKRGLPYNVLIAADGDHVVVAWNRCALDARASSDGGATWAPNWTDVECPPRGSHYDGGSTVESVDVIGSRIALSVEGGGCCAAWTHEIVRTRDDFVTSSSADIGTNGWRYHFLVGFTIVDGRPVLATAFKGPPGSVFNGSSNALGPLLDLGRSGVVYPCW